MEGGASLNGAALQSGIVNKVQIPVRTVMPKHSSRRLMCQIVNGN